MLERVLGKIGIFMKKKEVAQTQTVCLPTEDEPQSCQAHPHDPEDLKEIERLQSEVVAFELELGRQIIEKERQWEKSRLKTISKRHLQTAKYKTHQKWVMESKCLIRYYNFKKENDSDVATEMLLPISQKYREARAVD